MLKKILFCASTASHMINFHLPYLKAFHEKGYEVWVGTNKEKTIPYADRVVALPFYKKLTSLQNIKAIFIIRKLLKKEKFTVISTHTTLASAVVRAAVLLLNKKPQVFNTSHGYLFHEQDGLKKWIYLLPEKFCAKITDCLMVMNHEDFEIAQRHHLYQNSLYYIDGMGIDLSRFRLPSVEERRRLRTNKGFGEEDFLFVYAAEFSKRKNHKMLLKTFAELYQENKNVYLLLAGTGQMLEEAKIYAEEWKLGNHVQFLGYITEIHILYPLCDASVSSSLIEGLPFNVMEAMASGLPVIASDIKGHRELIENGINGFLYASENGNQLLEKMKLVCTDEQLREKFKTNALEKIKQFGVEQVHPAVMKIYDKTIEEYEN